MKTKLIKNLLALSLVLLSTTSIQAQEKSEKVDEPVEEYDINVPENIPVSRDGDYIYDEVAVEAAYPGGRSALLLDLAENFHYTDFARENGIVGRLVLSFVVEKDGTISNPHIIRKLGYGLDESALKALKSIKTFTPAYQDDEPVRSYYSVPINLELE